MITIALLGLIRQIGLNMFTCGKNEDLSCSLKKVSSFHIHYKNNTCKRLFFLSVHLVKLDSLISIRHKFLNRIKCIREENPKSLRLFLVEEFLLNVWDLNLLGPFKKQIKISS